MARLTLQLLGGFSGRVRSGQALSLGTKKAQALIAYLAVPPGRAHSRDKVASLLWGDTGDEQARQSLRQTLVALRRALNASKPPILLVDRDSLALAPAAIEVDVQVFECLAAGGSAKALDQAMAHYQGDLLEGFRVNEEPFEDWLRAERARLRQLAVETLTRLLALQSKAGETERAVLTAARLLALDPVQEAVHRTLMRLYARQGRRGEALRQYQVCVGVLQRELGVQPEADTRQIYHEILRRPQRTHAAAALRRPTEYRPLPAPPVIAATPTPLIGRDSELTTLGRALGQARAGSGQLVIIVGEAGIGKTRLTEEIAAEAQQTGVRLLPGRCYEGDQILPFGPWVDALRTSGIASDSALLGELAPLWRAELARLLPEVEAPGLPTLGDNPLRLFESVAKVMERVTARQPGLVVLEDLHWADQMTLRLLAFVARRSLSWRLLLVVTARDEELVDASAAQRGECGTLPLPRRVREVIASRLERLSDRGRQLASVAAVIGREFDFPLLHRVADLDEQATAEGVEELVRRSVLRGVGERFDSVMTAFTWRSTIV